MNHQWHGHNPYFCVCVFLSPKYLQMCFWAIWYHDSFWISLFFNLRVKQNKVTNSLSLQCRDVKIYISGARVCKEVCACIRTHTRMDKLYQVAVDDSWGLPFKSYQLLIKCVLHFTCPAGKKLWQRVESGQPHNTVNYEKYRVEMMSRATRGPLQNKLNKVATGGIWVQKLRLKDKIFSGCSEVKI